MNPSNLERRAGEQADRRAPVGFPCMMSAAYQYETKGLETRPNKKQPPDLSSSDKLQEGEADSQGT